MDERTGDARDEIGSMRLMQLSMTDSSQLVSNRSLESKSEPIMPQGAIGTENEKHGEPVFGCVSFHIWD
jgi:hypothetical protein